MVKLSSVVLSSEDDIYRLVPGMWPRRKPSRDGTRVDIEVEKLRKLSEEFTKRKQSREESPIVNGFAESTPPPDRFRRSFSYDGYSSDRGSDRRSVDRRSVSPTRSLYNGSESGRKQYTFHRCCSSSERDTTTCDVHNPGRCSAQERWQKSLRRSTSRCRSRSPSLDRGSRRSASRSRRRSVSRSPSPDRGSRRSASRSRRRSISRSPSPNRGSRRSTSRPRRRSVSRSPSPNRFRRSVGRSSRSPSPRGSFRRRGGRTPSPNSRSARSSSRSRRSPSRSPSPTFSVRSSYSVRSFRSTRCSGSRSPDRSRQTYHKCCGRRSSSPDSSNCALHSKARLSRSLSRTSSTPRRSSSKSPSRILRRSASRSPERSHRRSGSRSPPRSTSTPRTFRRSSSRSPPRVPCILNRSSPSNNNNNDCKYNNNNKTPSPQNSNHIKEGSPNNHSNKQNGLPPIAPTSRKDSKAGQGDQDQSFLPQTLPDLPSFKMPSQRRFSEDNFRRPLATLHEDEVVARRRFSEDVRKKSFDTSAVEDDIYKHQRKLSEAGVRRLSDASVILTEDTDSFIIGDRVWVGGTKGGNISYIGETQFAPGEWAGITLDEPIGKNDGSVAGVRYFQCEAKKGVFSRLTRLSRTPLTDQDIEAMASKSSTAGSDSPKTNGTPTPSVISGTTPGRNNSVSSVPATPAARKVTPASAATTPTAKASSPMTSSVIRKTSSSSSPVSGELKIGDRVVINSTTGVKFGVLRYRGATEFAEGDWAGVELDEPNGKNDGSVAGKRYFECKQKYGLFAPIARVSRFTGGAATPRRSSTTTPATPSRLRRSGSRESIGASSVASSTTSSVRGTRRPSRTSTGSSSVPSTKALQDEDDWDDDGFY